MIFATAPGDIFEAIPFCLDRQRDDPGRPGRLSDQHEPVA
jgi:hypothetical protein